MDASRIHALVKLAKTAFRGRLKTYQIEPTKLYSRCKIGTLLAGVEYIVEPLLEYSLRSNRTIKVNVQLICFYEQPHERGSLREVNLKTCNKCLYGEGGIPDFLSWAWSKLIAESGDFTDRGSGWVFHSVKQLEIRVNRYSPLTCKTSAQRCTEMHRRIKDCT